MRISAALLTTDLTSSTRLSIENIFLMPSTGLSLSSDGVSFLPVTIGPTCRNSTSTPRNRASASSGSDSHTRVSNATYPTSRTPTSNGWPTAAMLASNSSCILRYMKPISSQPPTSQPSTSTVLVSSLLLATRSEEHTSELQSLMRISYAVFCLKKTIKQHT